MTPKPVAAASRADIPGLVEGRIVRFMPPTNRHFVHPETPILAVVVKVWSRVSGCCNLRLLCDGTNDHPYYREIEWQTSVGYDLDKGPYTWHFPEAAQATPAPSHRPDLSPEDAGA